MSHSYLSKKVEQRKSSIDGIGLFAKENISKGEIFAIKGGSIVHTDDIHKIDKKFLESFLQFDDSFFIGPKDEQEYVSSTVRVNHSCNPNGGLHGNITGVAMRDISTGEEITNDYAMFSNESLIDFTCNCGSVNCRGVVTGNDWKNKTLQEKYRGYFSLYLEEKIKNIHP